MSRNGGFNLIELMISIALSTILILMIVRGYSNIYGALIKTNQIDAFTIEAVTREISSATNIIINPKESIPSTGAHLTLDNHSDILYIRYGSLTYQNESLILTNATEKYYFVAADTSHRRGLYVIYPQNNGVFSPPELVCANIARITFQKQPGSITILASTRNEKNAIKEVIAL